MSLMRSFVLFLFSRYFSIVRIPPSFTAIRSNPNLFVIITPGSSLVIQAMLLSFARRSGLAGITHASQGSSEQLLRWISIEDEAGLAQLVKSENTVNFTTLNIFRGRGPVKNNPRYHMSVWRQTGLLIACRFLTIIFGKPIVLTHQDEVHRKLLARRLKLDFYRNLKLVRGTPFQTIDAQANTILSGVEFEREVRIIATRMNSSERGVKELARRAFFKMAANPRAPVYWLVSPLVRFFSSRLFSEVSAHGIEQLAEAIRENTVVLVPMHRSHLDYVLLGFKLYDANLNPPVVAAGVNLNFWPFGFLIRSLGGYFVKREARHDRIHAMLLKRYVTYLIKRGHLQEFFIEGGRSRSGKMAQPKLGLLSTMVTAFLKGVRRDILFIPVSFTYENLMEDEVFGDENTGRSKTKENLKSLLAARELFRRKYGEVIVRFGEAISLSAFISQIEPNDITKRIDSRTITGRLASRISQNIRDQSDISLTSLAYSALMMSPGYGLIARDLNEQVKNLAHLSSLVVKALNFPAKFTNSLQSFLHGKESIISDLVRGRIVTQTRFLDTDAFVIPGRRRFTADFYRNSSVHLLFMPALMSLLELMNREISTAEAIRFHEILSFEFQLGSREQFEQQFHTLCLAFKAHGILIESDGKLRFAQQTQGIFIPNLLAANLESLLWVYLNLERTLEQPDEGSETPAYLGSIGYAALMTQMLGGFKTASYLTYFHRTEAASQSALALTLESLRAREVITIDESKPNDRRVVLLKHDLNVIDLLKRANAALKGWDAQRHDSPQGSLAEVPNRPRLSA